MGNDEGVLGLHVFTAIEQKNRGLAQNLNILLQSLVVLVKLRQLSSLGLLFRDRRD